MPFVTERIWAAIPHPSDPPYDVLMTTPFPIPGGVRDTATERTYETIINTVRDLRRTRVLFTVGANRRLGATFYVADEQLL